MSTTERQQAVLVPEMADYVARIASGDRSAEQEFILAYERGVRVLVRRHCRPNDSAIEDIVQEVLANVLERLRCGAIRDNASLPAYLQVTIVRMTSAEYRNRQQMQPETALLELHAPDNPAEELASYQTARILRGLLAHLPVARDREVLARFYLDEQDRDEVCRQLGIEVSHFHRVIFRARERFRELLDCAGIQGN